MMHGKLYKDLESGLRYNFMSRRNVSKSLVLLYVIQTFNLCFSELIYRVRECPFQLMLSGSLNISA